MFVLKAWKVILTKICDLTTPSFILPDLFQSIQNCMKRIVQHVLCKLPVDNQF